jgi:hypothetical protein
MPERLRGLGVFQDFSWPNHHLKIGQQIGQVLAALQNNLYQSMAWVLD